MKRFTETTLFDDPWFRKLPVHLKVFWEFLRAKCDNAGVWDPDLSLASFTIGAEITEKEILEHFNNGKERIEVLPNGKWFLPQFIEFQYGELKPQCYPHQKVRELVVRHGLLEKLKSRVGGRVVATTCRTTLKEEEEVTNRYIEELSLYWNKTSLPKILTISKNRKDKIRVRLTNGHFRANWKAAIDKMSQSSFCTGHNKNNWKATIDWFIDNDNNYLKALEGKYDDKYDPLAKLRNL